MEESHTDGRSFLTGHRCACRFAIVSAGKRRRGVAAALWARFTTAPPGPAPPTTPHEFLPPRHAPQMGAPVSHEEFAHVTGAPYDACAGRRRSACSTRPVFRVRSLLVFLPRSRTMPASGCSPLTAINTSDRGALRLPSFLLPQVALLPHAQSHPGHHEFGWSGRTACGLGWEHKRERMSLQARQATVAPVRPAEFAATLWL